MTVEMMSFALMISPFAGIGIGLLAMTIFELWTGRYDEADPASGTAADPLAHLAEAARQAIDRRR